MTHSSSSDFFRVECPQCGKSIRVPESMHGRKGKCPGCAGPIQIPSRPKTESTPATIPKERPPAPPPPPQRPTVVEPSEVAPNTTNVFTPAGQPTAVQVNVQNSNVSNSLGIASLVVGILSLFVCWIPLIGFGLSGLGFLLGIGGIVMSMTRKGTGIGYAIAGTAISGFGVLLGIVFIVALQGMAEGFSEVAEQMERDLSSESQQASPATNDRPAEDNNPIPEDQPNNEVRSGDRPQVPEFHDASKPLQLGNIQLEITAVHIGKVPLYRTIMKEDTESVEDLLTVWLNITNTSSNKKIDYQGWMSDYASLRDIDADLTDDNDNRYRGISFSATTTVKDAQTNESIYPGKSITDAVVFEIPIDGVKHLDLRLSAKGCKEDGEFRFRIPVDMVQR